MSDIITNFPVNFKSIVLDVSEGLQDQTHTYIHTDEHPAYFITGLVEAGSRAHVLFVHTRECLEKLWKNLQILQHKCS